MREERLGWDDPWLASLDLEYHNINPDQGLLPGLEAEGKTFASPATATSRARTRTERRGGIRGLCVRRFRDQIKSVQWERVQFKGMLIPKVLEMGDLFEPEAVSCRIFWRLQFHRPKRSKHGTNERNTRHERGHLQGSWRQAS